MACSKYAFPEEMTIEILKRMLTDKEPSLLMIAKSKLDALPPLVSPDFKCYVYEPHRFTEVSSCNGIICLVFGIHCYLWNPVTKKCKEVPQFPGSRKVFMLDPHARRLAFYFDTICNDYKVLRLLCENPTTGELPVLQLYSTNTNSWREIHVQDTSPTKVMSYPYLKLGPVINGAIYMGCEEYVVSFDLNTEVCTVVPTPSSMVRYSEILDFEGSVAVVFGSGGERSEISLWTLDNIHGKISWSKKFNIVQNDMGWIYSCLGGGLLYGRTRGDFAVFLYDCRKKDFKYVPLPDSRLKTFLKYTETLASIDGLKDDLYKFRKTVSLI
ncbi:hypothetical protein POM88_047701 [Heracleum sosnowskyi]|uniref:F-box associated beta-propeller type 3 domain-containing protein n=1 Tax=Heracleum sosnowskyi TaxID=360622 RepID=A0AAD8GUN8_9APIA|nr:hypothetical protein POM88_047701 [Heracleum sosnowskyi]